MEKNKKAFSLIIAMWLVLISSLLAFTILEFIVPFSKDIKWIENSTKSYYMANSWIESWLFFFSKRTDANLRNEDSKWYTLDYDYKYNTFSSWSQIPLSWKWNWFNPDYNTVSAANPIQLSIWYNFININNIRLDIKVPNFTWLPVPVATLSWATLPILNWQISSEDKTLNSTSWSVIKASQICNSVTNCSINISTLLWRELDWSSNDIVTFYGNNCWATKKCILKFSILDDLQLQTWQSIPYLEWKISAWLNSIPLQYSTIESEWKSTWFVKKLKINVPQETVSEAFDFTVFQ